MTRKEAELRQVDPQRLWAVVRAVLDLRGELVDPRFPSDVEPGRVTLDAWAWLGWVEVGLRLFSVPCPDIEEPAVGPEPIAPMAAPVEPAVPPLCRVVEQAQRVALVLAMVRHRGNVTHAARALQTSRRTLRGHLAANGLYPWDSVLDPQVPEGDDPGEGPRPW